MGARFYFVSAGWASPATPEWNGKRIADLALAAGMLLSPGEFFQLRPSGTVWFRFNAAYSDTPQLRAFLQTQRPQ